MSNDEGIEEEYLTCYICYDVFKEPKTLTCLHRFCELCLQGYLIGLKENAKKKGFPCPVCREINPAPDPKRPAADWASLIRTDFHLKSLINALKVKADATRGQEVGRGGSRGREAGHPCHVHADVELDLYCVDCNSSICHLCAGISHRGCSQVITLAEAAADRRATAELQHRRLSDRLGRLCHLRAQIDSAVEALSAQRGHAERSIRHRSEATIAAVRRKESELVEDLTRKFQTLRGDVAKRLVAMDNRISDCQQALETMSGKAKSASDMDIVRSMASTLRDDLLDMDEQKMHNVLLRLKCIRLEHRHPSTSGDSINLGEVAVDMAAAETHTAASSTATTVVTPPSPLPARTRPPVVPRRKRSQTLPITERAEHAATEAGSVRLRTISGKFREDQSCPKLRDVLVMIAGQETVVLATDWANQCVKVFHDRRDRDSRLCLGGKPWCLTRVTDTAVAVSLPVSTQICVIKVIPRPALQSSFFAQKRYSGLAALNADTLVASGGSDPPCVDIINLGGEVLRSFSRDVATGAQLFDYPGYLSMMPDRRHFLVSDRHRAALFCLDISGHVKFLFRPPGNLGLREPSGVKVDSEGGIYLAEARGVVKLTAQGKLDRPLLRAADGVEDPRGLALSDSGLMYVISHEQDIVVFKVSSQKEQ